MVSPSLSTLAAFHRFFIRDEYGKPAEEAGFKREFRVIRLVYVGGSGTKVGTLTM